MHGRKIRVLALDDAYDPKRAEANTRHFIEDAKVLALFQYAGTPPALAGMALAEQTGVPLIAPFTGSEELRKPGLRYVFNIKAGYATELHAMMRAPGLRGPAQRGCGVPGQPVRHGRIGGTAGLGPGAGYPAAGQRPPGCYRWQTWRRPWPRSGSTTPRRSSSSARASPAWTLLRPTRPPGDLRCLRAFGDQATYSWYRAWASAPAVWWCRGWCPRPGAKLELSREFPAPGPGPRPSGADLQPDGRLSIGQILGRGAASCGASAHAC